MGVTRKSNNSYLYAMPDGLFNDFIEESFLEDLLIIEDSPNVSPEPVPQVKKRRKSKKNHLTVEPEAAASPRKQGVRVARRRENLNYLLGLQADGEDLYSNNVVEPATSHFAELLEEAEKMKIWNHFIESSEEEQTQILTGFVKEIRKNEKCQKEIYFDLAYSSHARNEEVIDMRDCHPSFTAKECYNRIDRQLRTYLRRMHVPKMKMKSIEETVRAFFNKWPSKVYISKLDCSLERLLMHAVCQYLALSSQSYSTSVGGRRTKVRNLLKIFAPPDRTLESFLS